MAYANFKPLITSKSIQTELEKFITLAEDCNRQFEGEAAKGERVKIVAAYRPTVKTFTPGTNIDSAETPPDAAVYLDIDQYKYTNISMGDIDKAQSIPGTWNAYMEGIGQAHAENRDSYVATMAKYAGSLSTSAVINTAAGAKTAVDTAFIYLWENSVKINADVVINITPWFYTLFKDKLTELYTNNIELIKKGIVGMYNGATVKMSNNLYNDGTDDYMMIRTTKAVAFASGIKVTEPYRPDLGFEDCFKVLDTYGAKMVRPKECYTIKARKA